MPPTTSYSFGDIVLVSFPFTDQSATKKRPAVIISSPAYNDARPDLIIMALTSQMRSERPECLGGMSLFGVPDWMNVGIGEKLWNFLNAPS